MKETKKSGIVAPPQARGQARREQILSAATAILLEYGYAGFSMRGIATHAGVRLSHVQYYFPEPSQIVAVLLDRFIQSYAGKVLEVFHAGASPARTRLVNALNFLLNDEEYRHACSVFMLEVSAFAVRDRKIAEAVERYYSVYLAAIETMASEINPGLRASERRLRAGQCVALIEGMAATRRFLGPDAEPAFSAKAAAQAVEQLLS